MRTPTIKFLILRLLEREPKSGYELIKEMRNIVGEISPGAVYPLLKWWEGRGFIEKKDKYTLTEKGRRFLREMEEKRSEYIEMVKRDLIALSQALDDEDLEQIARTIPTEKRIGYRGIVLLSEIGRMLSTCNKREEIYQMLEEVLSKGKKLCKE